MMTVQRTTSKPRVLTLGSCNLSHAVSTAQTCMLPITPRNEGRHLYGRSKEIKLLLEAYSRCKDGRGAGTPECVLITGSSGMGKTSLVQAVLRPTVTFDRGIFLAGKFELSPHYQPYEVIVSTFAQLADQLLTGDDRLYDIQMALADALGDEIRILYDFIPGLESVVEDEEPERKSDNNDGTESLSRFQFLFCKFCRTIASVVPLVIFLDDMQWCDHASLELIQALLRPKLGSSKSYSKSSLLLVAASRDEIEKIDQECNTEEKSEEGSPPLYMINNFLNGAKPSRNISRIHLSSLSETETAELIAHHFGLTTEAAQAMASQAFAKCCGNILHTLQYIRLIPDLQPISTYEQQRLHETKDPENETDMMNEPDTVERLILKRVHKLPISLQGLLQMAGSMGNVINETALSTITGSSSSDIINWLKLAVKEELLELVPNNRSNYLFVHDSIRQAVLSMIDDRNEMSFRIGQKLWQHASLSDKDSSLFTIVNLLNKGINLTSNAEESYKVAEMNLIAGRKAASKVSFRDASRYYNAGIEFLRTGNGWTEQYDLALQLYSAAASAERANQNLRRVDLLIEEIFQRAHCFEDKLDAYATQIVATGQQGKVVEATNIGLDVLRKLGEKVPTQTEVSDIQPHVIETERALRGLSNADILSLPDMEDNEKLTAMRFLVMMIPYALESGSPYTNWIATRMVRLTLSHGLSKGCAHGFASYARFICTSNARLGYNYGQLAALIVDECGAQDLMPRVYVSVYSMTSIWTRPLRESLTPLNDAFEVAVEYGDVEYALLAGYFRSFYSVYVGMNLVQVEQLLKETRGRLKFYKQSLLLTLTDILLQFVHNLTGKADDPKCLAGEAFRMQDQNVAGISAVAFVFHGFNSKLAYLFGDLDLADQSAQVMFEVNSRAPFTSYAFAINQLQIGLIAIAQVRRGIEVEKNLERGQFCIKKMVGWARDCPDNFLNKKSLLDAEMESLKSQTSLNPNVISLYNQAIEGALEEGFLDEAAIACERAGDYMHQHNNAQEAERFWNQAQRIFRRWGATSKADSLKSRLAASRLNCVTSGAHPLECVSLL